MRKVVLATIVFLAVFSLVGAGCNISLPGLSATPGPQVTTTPPPLEPSWTPPRQNGAPTPLPTIADVVPRVTPSVVSIQTEALAYDVFLRPYPETGAGTGVIIDSNGYVLTNNHVVEGAQKVKVALSDGRTFDAVDVRRDPASDIAVVKIDARGLPAARIGDSSQLRLGDWVIAVGNALALEGGPTVTAGIVSNLGRSIQESTGAVLYDMIQTSAAINPGNSGGPLVNMAGQVVGINTAIAADAQNIGFAIAINPAMQVAQSLINKGFVGRAFLGISMTTVTQSVARRYNLSVQSGVLVASISAGSPAEKAGIQVGDVITRFGGQDMATDADLRRAIVAHRVGDEVEVVLYRGADQLVVKAVLSESPPPQ